MENDTAFDKLAIRYGLLTTLVLIAYFLIMKLIGFVHVVELRVFNMVILTYGIWMALKVYIKQTGDDVVYLRTLALGVFTSLAAVIPFAIFIFIYMSGRQIKV